MKNLITFLIILFSFKSNGQDETMKFIIKSNDASICDKGKVNLSVDVSLEITNSSSEKSIVVDNKLFELMRHSVNWYNEASSGENIGKGISFTTPEISNSKTYFSSVNYSGGLPVNTEDYKKVSGEGLIFDIFTPTVLNTVEVNSNMQGKIFVVIKKSDGTQIINKSFPVTNGLNKLPINCSLPSGLGFTIEAFGLSPDIKLTTIKHDIWPITLGKFGQIVEGTKNKKKYNYFFNWDVSTERVPVSASIIKSTQNITTKSECDKYFWKETSETYDKSGTYTNVNGCHTEKLNLTITPSRKNSEAASACDSYLWTANGKKYETSGTYTTTYNCLTKELNLTIDQSKTNVTTQTSTDSFTWGVNNNKYEVSGTYIEVRGCLTEKLVLKINYTDGIIPQSVLNNRNPDSRKDFANVYFDPRYTLFDFWSDEPILPDENNLYHIWISDNETRIPLQFDGNAEKLSHTAYKFKNLANCKNWCDNIPFSNTTNSIANSTNTNSNSKTQTFKEVKIGNQIWMKENLNVDHFRNGETIKHCHNQSEWDNANENKEPAFCYLDDDEENGSKYGKLYNWFAVNDPRGLAPEGYHVPKLEEWHILGSFVTHSEKDISSMKWVMNSLEYKDAGRKLKSSNNWPSYTTGGYKTCPHCEDWNTEYRSKRRCDVCRDKRFVPTPTITHSGNGTNSYGFSGMPGGARTVLGSGLRDNGYWWSSTQQVSDLAYQFSLQNNFDKAVIYSDGTRLGFSVRCIKN